jgi:hypothetical protein
MTPFAARQRCSITVPSPTALKHSHMMPLDARQRCFITVQTPTALKRLNWIKTVQYCHRGTLKHLRNGYVAILYSCVALAH